MVGCSAGIGEDAGSPFDPEARAVRLEITGCESGSRARFGSGVVIEDGLVVTVAHLIVDAETVEASVAGASLGAATVAAVDLRKDLAALRVEDRGVPPAETSILDQGESGLIVGGAASGTVPFEVRRRVNLTIEEILGTDRHARLGYEVAAVTADGDSGAGAYDAERRLVGLVFAVGKDGGTTWLTAGSEIEDFVASIGPSDRYAPCE
jgi:S1-C subfamily serine protease